MTTDINGGLGQFKAFMKQGLNQLFKSLNPFSSLRIPMPAPLSWDNLSILLHDAALELARNSHSSQPVDGDPFTDLFNVLFVRDFLTHLSPRLDLPDSQGLLVVDFLLAICKQGGDSVFKANPESFALLRRLLPTPTDTEQDDHHDHDAFTLSFCKHLTEAWPEESFLREATKWSPMPWSARARTEGVPPTPASFDESAPYATLPDDLDQSGLLRDDLLYFPDVVWLGASHDGYCRATSLSAYVWLRLTTASSQDEFFALWQSALTFGILEIVTGMRIPEDVLLSRQPDDSFVLTSKKISLLISSWLFVSPPAVETPLTLQQLDHSFDMVDWALAALNEAVLDYRQGRGFFRSMDPALSSHEINDIACSLNTFFSWLPSVVKRLRASLALDMAKSRAEQRTAIRNALRAESEAPPTPLLYGMLHQATWEAYERRLVAAGWCPHTTSLLSFDSQAIGFVSIAHPFFRNNSEGVWEHAKCSRAACVAYNLNPDDYRTQHAPSCLDKSCAFLSPSLARVSELLSAGEMPVIIYSDGALTVRSASEGPFIAISHVWADGLGSVTEDGLPICQIARIAQYTREFVPDGAFWVDSLCVPSVKELRKRAIHLMADTYRRAEKVIVFDAGIRASPTTPLREIFLRITTSAWMQRVWTLQEAFLARDIYFELSDRLLPMQHLADACDAAAGPIDCALGTSIPRDFALFPCLTETLMLMFERASRTFSFRDIVTLLDHRATSKPEDETVAIAGLLGIDVAKLLAEPDPDGRMRAFLLEVGTLPASIIVHAGHAGRLPQPGFRWAPRALTALSVVVAGEQFGMAKCTSEGLTTEQKFSLIVLPKPMRLKRTDEAKEVLGPVSIVNPSSGATYAVMGHDSMLGDESVPFNALVAVPAFLELLKYSTSLLPVVAVWLTTPRTGILWNRQPVECQYLFNAGLSDMTSVMSMYGINSLDDEDGTIVQGRFDSARIRIT